MNKYQFIITPIAQDNLERIAEYLHNELKSEKAATNFLDEFQTKIQNICAMPKMYKLAAYPKFNQAGIRIAMLKKYKIYFHLNEEENKVTVLYIKHSLQHDR